MLAAAPEAEVNQYIAESAAEVDERGHRPVAGNGHHQPRTVVTAAGPVEVTVPRVNDRRATEATGERQRFSSKIPDPWCRKSPKVSEVLPLLYLHGLSTEPWADLLRDCRRRGMRDPEVVIGDGAMGPCFENGILVEHARRPSAPTTRPVQPEWLVYGIFAATRR